MFKNKYKNPIPAVDIIIRDKRDRIVLIERKNKPYGWALPGGLVDYGETLENAALRKVKKEIGLNIELVKQFHTYSDPNRDSRGHYITTVFIADHCKGILMVEDDAKNSGFFDFEEIEYLNITDGIVFDHYEIINDYFNK